MLYADKTEKLINGLFDVQNEVRTGKQEENYHRAYRLWLEDRDIPFASKAKHPLVLNGETVHNLHPDFVAWNCITIELKAEARKLKESDYVQLFDYLKRRGDRVGLLVNMGLNRVHVERVAYDPPDYEIVEDWDYWSGAIGGRDREVGMAVREGLRSIYDAHQTGYGSETTSKLIHAELRHRRLPCLVAPSVETYYRGESVGEAKLECIVVDDRIALTFTALFDHNDFSIGRGLAYLDALELEWGIAVNFGKKAVQINGLRRLQR